MSPRAARLCRFFATALRPLTASVLAATLFVLGLLSVRPDWHELVCRHEASRSSHACTHAAHDAAHGHAKSDGEQHADADQVAGCAVSLFGQGHVLSLAPCVLTLPEARISGTVTTFEAIILARTAYLLPQGHAPPAVRV